MNNRVLILLAALVVLEVVAITIVTLVADALPGQDVPGLYFTRLTQVVGPTLAVLIAAVSIKETREVANDTNAKVTEVATQVNGRMTELHAQVFEGAKRDRERVG